MSYTDLTTVKAELKIATGTTTDDALITGYCTIAQATIEANRPLGTGRVFEAAADTTRYLDAPAEASSDPDGPSYLLLLPQYGDLCQITSIVNGDGETIPGTAYVLEPRSLTTGPWWGVRLKRNAGYTWAYDDSPEGAIAITGRWAYSVTAPTPIVRAATRLAVAMYRARDNAGASDQTIQTEQGIILPAAQPKDVRQIIESYWTIL